MTTILEEKKICKVCGEISTHNILGSINNFGSPDLDTRPPEMERSTISYWIKMCPNCHYCAPDISEGDIRVKEIVKSEEYKQISRQLEFPDKAIEFLSHSYIMDIIENFEDAAWACLHAAWYCDDDEMEFAAGLCREKAVDAFQKAKRFNNNILSEPKGAFNALIVDLLRRIPKIPDASEYCTEAIEQKPDKLILKILLYQKELIKNRNTGCYTIDHVIKKYN